MSRRVVPRTRAPGSGVDVPTLVPDDYLGRLVKYVPAEVLALYVTAAGIVPREQPLLLWAVAIGCAVLTPVYLRWATSRGGRPPLRIQIVLGTIAFPIWLFAMGGPFEAFAWYDAWRPAGSIALLFATVVFPLFAPAPDG